MSIERAVARVSELQTMAAQGVGMSPGALGAALPNTTGAARFQEMLETRMLSPNGPTGAGSASGGGAGGAGGATMVPAGPPPGQYMTGLAPVGAGVPAKPAAAVTMVTGDLKGLDPALLQKLDQLGQQLGRKIDVISGFRSREEQERLYQMFLNGTGNLAAKPGTSNHESGNAADVYIDGVALASVPGAREAAARLGLHFPVPGEAWHVEAV